MGHRGLGHTADGHGCLSDTSVFPVPLVFAMIWVSTDVEELHQWHVQKVGAHPCFRPVPREEAVSKKRIPLGSFVCSGEGMVFVVMTVTVITVRHDRYWYLNRWRLHGVFWKP